MRRPSGRFLNFSSDSFENVSFTKEPEPNLRPNLVDGHCWGGCCWSSSDSVTFTMNSTRPPYFRRSVEWSSRNDSSESRCSHGDLHPSAKGTRTAAEVPHLGITLSLPQIGTGALLELGLQKYGLHIGTDRHVRPYETAAGARGDPLIGVQAMYPDQLPEYTPSVARSADC